jgi:anthranilate synthase component 1
VHSPPLPEFLQHASTHALIPVSRRLLSDNLTPVNAFARLDNGDAACLFESVIGGEKVGRYSFLAYGPKERIVAYGNEVQTHAEEGVTKSTQKNPLDSLRDWLDSSVGNSKESIYHPEDLPPFVGGAVGYAGYDVVRYVENLPDAPADDRNLPDLAFGMFHNVVVFDNVSKTMTVIALAETDAAGDESKNEVTYATACKKVDEIVAQLQTPRDLPAVDLPSKSELALLAVTAAQNPELKANITPADYEAAVARGIEYIREGDIFQVVLSQRLEREIQSDPLEIYRTLRVINPSPFMFLLRMPEVTLVGSSPEIMCRVMDGKVTVRPLAGTRPRGKDEAEDQKLAEELLADEKELAEHVMLVDLGRNDVGRVSKYGTVELTDVMTIERYSHVMHITSNVTGELVDAADALDALAASLPAGTVSGAPKVRAMQIIDELETTRRGPYAGAVGYLDYGGNMDTCIALRTLVISRNKAYVQVGAGIVADSVPAEEYQETLNKARGLLLAIELTERRR